MMRLYENKFSLATARRDRLTGAERPINLSFLAVAKEIYPDITSSFLVSSKLFHVF